MAFVRSCSAVFLLLFSASLVQAQSGFNAKPTDVVRINPTFTTIDVPGAGSTNISGINSQGDLVGWFGQTADSPTSGFLLSAGTFTYLSYPGSSSTMAFRINDSGLIVGTAFLNQNTAAVGFSYNGSAFTKIQLDGQHYTYVDGIDNAGDIVGGLGSFGGNQGYERVGTRIRNVTPPGTYTLVYATAINNFGQIVGTADEGSFFYNAGKYKTITFPGASQTYAYGINDGGMVVGWYFGCAPNCGYHGFVLAKGRYLSFDYPGAVGTFGVGISSAGQIVGTYTLDNIVFHGFITDPLND